MANETALTLLGGATVAGVYVAKKGIDTLAELVGALLMPSAKDAGLELRDFVRKRRERATAVVRDAGSLLDEHSGPVIPVPGRVLFPLLEAASLEEDDALRAMWVKLLASAGDARTSSDVLPSFVTILRDLSPAEALVLKALYEVEGFGHSRIDYSADGPGARFNPRSLLIRSDDALTPPVTVQMPFSNFRVLADNLARLGLVDGVFRENGEYGHLTLTPLGHHLMMVCVRYPNRFAP